MSDEFAVDQILAVLTEGIEGPRTALTYFLDKGPDTGLRNMLGGVSAVDASRSIGGNSIAAHAHHLVFSARVFGMFIAGDRRRHDWQESWRVSAVDDAEWNALRGEVLTSYDELRNIVREHARTDAAAMGGAVGVAAHLAYHIGAMRQKIAVLKESAQ